MTPTIRVLPRQHTRKQYNIVMFTSRKSVILLSKFSAVLAAVGRATGFHRKSIPHQWRLRGTEFRSIGYRRRIHGRQHGNRFSLRGHDASQRTAQAHVFNQRQVHQRFAVNRSSYAQT